MYSSTSFGSYLTKYERNFVTCTALFKFLKQEKTLATVIKQYFTKKDEKGLVSQSVVLLKHN